MDARQAFALANASPPPSFGRFYGDASSAAIGAGMILRNVEYPTYLAENERFGVVAGSVLVLTHECDLDPDNDRLFSDAGVVCPILPLEDVAPRLDGIFTEKEAGTWIRNVTARNVNRLLYIPVIPEILPYGGYLYLNLIASTHRSRLIAEDVERVCMLSADGLREVDLALERHFRRPKSDRVPFQSEFVLGRQ